MPSTCGFDEQVDYLHKIESIKDEVWKLVSAESMLQDKITQLESELTVFKKAYTEASTGKTLLEAQYEQFRRDAERQKEVFEQQLQGSRVVVLLDGDGAIFQPQLIALGQAGGQKAAALLLDGVKERMLSLGGTRNLQTSVYIFYNKQGLTKTLSHSTERLMMVDVGSDKEAADTKLRAFLDDEIRLPQTFKLVFGGCHDNGYVTIIRSQITSGFKDKLILLKSYSENAAGYNDLQFPILEITGLFITEKLTASPTQTYVPLPKQSVSLADVPIRDTSPPFSGRNDTSQSSLKTAGRAETSPVMTYSKMLSKQVERHPTTDYDSSSENNDDDGFVTHNTGGTRRLNPSLPLSKQKPPPCTLFYLANNCKHGSDCRYAHDYILDAEHYEEMKKNAKKSPCPATNRDEVCTWGDNCCYGHTCPSGGKCSYFKSGKCKFIGNEVVRLLSSESELQERIKLLETDLQVYKRAFSDSNAEKRRLEEENEQLKASEKLKEILEKHAPASRVTVLLDGDGATFKPELIALGQIGGHKAASVLAESVKTHIRSLKENHQFQLSVYIFFNKRGLLDTLHRCNYFSARIRLEDFVMGFNQASERFIMVDVGNGKEAADSKIKAFLEDEIRLSQTYKILFGGGCHDNGYVTTIRSHITSGLKHKLILLQSYSEHAAGFDGLELPVLTIPGLFISQKLASISSQDLPAASRSLSPPLSDAPIQDTVSSNPTAEFGGHNPTPRFSPASYPSSLLGRAEHFSAFGSETASDHGNEPESRSYMSVPRRLDPKVPLSKQKPPPCTAFYLMKGCKHGNDCIYAHDYVLVPEHYAEIKANAKKAPCPAMNKNQNCTWGDACYYGHTCPFGLKCHYFKKGNCRFKGIEMHKAKDLTNEAN
ncbi:hypothetical protein NP233_g1285 [Leucocoprinus birnbaumii]|uniref:C3H1-type domain-containing protein n=1 Tax=Leucocoprinus birnbaumii TaxID=56174 RepID=A0AAD5W3A2_9AGAR|nr:hypothetical protein NP233_g1285 [Leucocoprinus birnbaumii]